MKDDLLKKFPRSSEKIKANDTNISFSCKCTNIQPSAVYKAIFQSPSKAGGINHVGYDILQRLTSFKKCEKECKFHFESSGDQLKSVNFPGHYQPFSDCKWTLEGPRGHRIVFQVTIN